MRTAALFIAFLAATAAAGASSTAAPSVRAWTGSYTLHGRSALGVILEGGGGVVALGTGHADTQRVRLVRRGTALRFVVPGRPSPVVFTGTSRGHLIRGTVRQGRARGAFRLVPGAAPGLFARGFFVAGRRTLAVVDDPYGPARLVDLDSGEVHALYREGDAFVVGSGFATRDPTRGVVRLSTGGGSVDGARATRVAVRQLEVRFRSGGATLAGTLTLPPGPGRHAAVAFVHGSGPTSRAYLPDLQALLVHNGLGVLAYDKRGVGQSGGTYPGESPTPQAIATLARDAEAAVRFLAAQPEVDPARVGLAGHSEAGWIIPLAASEEPAVRDVIVFSGPTVTADENDAYQSLTGAGDRPQQLTNAEIDAAVVARGPGGVDPIPWIRTLSVPGLWLYGGLDELIPSRLSVARLEPLARERGRDFELVVFPNANHALVETSTGLTSEMLRSDRFAPGLFARVEEWLRAHRLTAGT
ncbi:MAG: alpha/beta hydrolase family protein [Gaiellaceae bacterium]